MLGVGEKWAGSKTIGYAENDDAAFINSKSEYRNPKQIQNHNVPMIETNTSNYIFQTE